MFMQIHLRVDSHFFSGIQAPGSRRPNLSDTGPHSIRFSELWSVTGVALSSQIP